MASSHHGMVPLFLIKRFRITSESFIVFFSFGTIPIILFFPRITPLTSEISETAPH